MREMTGSVPDAFRSLFWDVDLTAIRLPEHTDYVVERVMSRGTWSAMCWLRAAFDEPTLRGVLARRGDRLAPRERAYWSLVLGAPHVPRPGGGRPSWAGS